MSHRKTRTQGFPARKMYQKAKRGILHAFDTEKDMDRLLINGGLKRRVLVVDDEMINRELLGAVLSDSYETIFASNGKEAMAALTEPDSNFSLILLDLLMPVMDGFEVIERCRADKKLRRIPIIVNGDAKDTHLETDVNNFFMAYRFHFNGEDYDKKTGIENVINTPVESLSVNLPLGSTVTCNAYIEGNKVGSADVFIAHNSGEGEYDDEFLTSVNDYTWDV